MTLIGKTRSYIFKNILYILPFALVCGLLISITYDQAAVGNVAECFFTGEIGKIQFYDLFRVMSPMNVSTWYFALISFALYFAVGVILSMQFALVEKHMRMGKRTFNGIWHKINDNFITTLGMTGLYILLLELWAVLTGLILFAVIKIFMAVRALQYIFVVILYAASMAAIAYAVQTLSLLLPCAQITGFTLFEALKYSVELAWKVKKEQFTVFLAFGIAYSALTLGVSFLGHAVPGCLFITYAFVFILTVAAVAFFTVGQEVAYFEADQLERADLGRKY